jgi:hypothetical protein
MKTLCIIAIGTLLAFAPSTGYGQGWKDKIGLTKKSGKAKGADLSEEETMELLGGVSEDEGITSDFHQAHLNQVVFTSKRMEPKDITEADVKTSFSINDPIYFTFFLPKSLRNHILYPLDKNGVNKEYYYDYSFKKWYHGPSYTSSNAQEGIPMINRYGDLLIYLEIDGVHISDIVFFVKVAFDSKATAFTGYISPVPAEAQPSLPWIERMQKLAEGDHKVKMEIAGYKKNSDSNIHMTEGLIATGGFTLTKSPGEKFAPVIGKSFKDYSAGMTDATLEKKFLNGVIAYGKTNGYKEKFSEVKIKDSRWYIKKHKITGEVLEKNIVVYCKSTFENGMCYVQEYIFRSQYNGSGYEEPYCSGIFNNSSPRAIDCD